jgi:hypothetical protein
MTVCQSQKEIKSAEAICITKLETFSGRKKLPVLVTSGQKFQKGETLVVKMCKVFNHRHSVVLSRNFDKEYFKLL